MQNATANRNVAMVTPRISAAARMARRCAYFVPTVARFRLTSDYVEILLTLSKASVVVNHERAVTLDVATLGLCNV